MSTAVFAEAPWPTRRLKFCVSYNDEVLSESTDDFEPIQYVEISDVSLPGGIEKYTPMLFHEAPSRARRRVRSGDILVSTVRTYLKAIAAVNEVPDNLIASTGFCVVRPKDELDAGYAGWVAKSEEFVGEVVSRSVGASYPAINASQLVDIEVPLPPLETQKRIAAFLDEKTARIEGLIEKKQALLDRLAEKRQAIITQAVTKGLNPAAPMKDSGVDWLGQIPAHWEIAPLRWYVRTRSGDGLTNEHMSAERTDEQKFPVVGGNGLMGYAEAANSKDTLLIIGRVGALCGNVHALAEPSWITDNALSVYGVRGYNARYLFHALRERDLNTLSARNAQPLITGEIVKAQLMPLPPKDEQVLIGQHCDDQNKDIHATTEAIRFSVSMLAEYRSSLITAAVTGQIQGFR